MKKFRVLLVAGLILVLLLAQGVASAFEIQSVSIQNDGTLSAILVGDSGGRSSDYSASTENGNLQVLDIQPWQKMESSWFIILDYVENYYKLTTKTAEIFNERQKDLVKDLSSLIQDSDNGALVYSVASPSVAVRKSSLIKKELQSSLINTDAAFLPEAIDSVMDYIHVHREELNPNIFVVILSPACFINEMAIYDLEDILLYQENSSISTYAISLVGSSESRKEWRDSANRLSRIVNQMPFGEGVVTSDISEQERVQALLSLKDFMRQRVLISIRPNDPQTVGRTITINGKSYTLSNDQYNKWQEACR